MKFFFALENTVIFLSQHIICANMYWIYYSYFKWIDTLKIRKTIDFLQQDSKYIMEFITYAKAKISDYNSTKEGKGKVGEHCYHSDILYMR